MVATAISSMCAALGANGPAQDILDKSEFFGWLVGAWNLEVLDGESEGVHRVNTGEWHFAWVLEGRAMQDVLISPKLAERRGGMPQRGNRYGTGLRVYDVTADRWRAFWINPVQGAIEVADVEKNGAEIVETGKARRNVFCEIAPDSFRYRIEKTSGGKSWKTITEILARRAG